MNASLQNSFALIGRILLALLFLPAGLSKISGFAGTAGYIGSVGLPLPEVAAAVAILVEVGGGLALIAGFGTRFAAIALALFTLVATFAFHNYWAMPADKVMIQQLMFFKNIAVVGGLLALAALGAGKLSLDGRRAAA
ncbi:MAG: DoxX family protein [Rhodoferax sp.]|jgi:putative oxidoreductase|nr:DoxX family protein [Rhodoferax sp.]